MGDRGYAGPPALSASDMAARCRVQLIAPTACGASSCSTVTPVLSKSFGAACPGGQHRMPFDKGAADEAVRDDHDGAVHAATPAHDECERGSDAQVKRRPVFAVGRREAGSERIFRQRSVRHAAQIAVIALLAAARFLRSQSRSVRPGARPSSARVADRCRQCEQNRHRTGAAPAAPPGAPRVR